MSDTATPTPGRGGLPQIIQPNLYPGLEDLRKHCSKDGVALIDRAYRDAVALFKRARAAEDSLAMMVEAPVELPGCTSREQAYRAGMRRPDPTDPTTSTEDAFAAGEELL